MANTKPLNLCLSIFGRENTCNYKKLFSIYVGNRNRYQKNNVKNYLRFQIKQTLKNKKSHKCYQCFYIKIF